MECAESLKNGRTIRKTNSGWFALIVALMCLPFGLMLLTLGVAKWLRNREQGNKGPREQADRDRGSKGA